MSKPSVGDRVPESCAPKPGLETSSTTLPQSRWRIYLDNAATSWPKPATVYDAVDQTQRHCGAAAGRGAYRHAQQAEQLIATARVACARLLGVEAPHQIAFTENGTAALNLAIHGLLSRGDHVVTTVCEHNSVLRPLTTQRERNGVKVSYVGCDPVGRIDLDAFREALGPHTRLAIVTHASNVTGALQPIAELASMVRARGGLLLVDAAQTAGCVPLNTESLGIDLLATGGHKGLLGPLGTGILYVRPGLEAQLHPLFQGGTGTHSQTDSQPAEMPQRLEAGNLNVPALAGLAAAANYLQQHTVEAIGQQIARRCAELWHGLHAIPKVRLVGPDPSQPRVGVVSCRVEGYDPQEVAAGLDATYGIQCRAGLHCAPRMHQALDSLSLGGLVRFSPGWATTADDIESTLNAVRAFAGG
ncbi:MAG: aminotransferase class V-fold PLP-dependent enzyme [Pirellulales bacterium]|nr:aminotransferase class V-fold PLP-dependent enzyme [Pirellulales bacterium]